MTHYLVYKTTCLITGKFYVGRHQTKNINDGYMGSGTLLLEAICKYGRENFITEVLVSCSDVKQMKLAERILVVCDPEVSYNVYPGGGGDFRHLNAVKTFDERSRQGRRAQALHPELRNNLVPATSAQAQKAVKTMRRLYGEGYFSSIASKPKSREHRLRISQALRLRGGSAQARVLCPHCGLVGGERAMRRWHFAKCPKSG